MTPQSTMLSHSRILSVSLRSFICQPDVRRAIWMFGSKCGELCSLFSFRSKKKNENDKSSAKAIYQIKWNGDESKQEVEVTDDV